MYEKTIPETDDLVHDVSWFIEYSAYNNFTDNCPRRQGFERKLNDFLKERNLKIIKKEVNECY